MSTPKTIKIEDAITFDREAFYGTNNGGYLEEIFYELIESDADINDLYVYVYIDRSADTVTYYGYSFGMIYIEDFKKLDHLVRSMTHNQLSELRSKINEKNRLSSDIARLEDTPIIKESDNSTTLSENTEADEPKIITVIRAWLKAVSFNSFCNTITDHVLGQEETEIIILNVYNYLRCIASGKKHNNNMLLAAPSGCGKTETYRAIRDYFQKKIPGLSIFQTDMTQITEEGYRGKNTKDLIWGLKKEDKGIGIVFLDEFDKKLIPSFSGHGQNTNLAVQSQILTLIEGRIIDEKGKEGIDTSKTLFIGMGAFNEARKKKKATHFVGYNAVNTPGEDHYTPITREDMIKLGASYELIGRFYSVINYNRLSADIIYSLIDRFVSEESDAIDVSINISDEMREKIFKEANSKYGCRILRSMIHQAAYKGYLELCKKGYDPGMCEIYIKDTDDVRVIDHEECNCTY